MRVVSVNVAQPRLVEWKDEVVATGIFKQPVSGPVRVGLTNLDGDRQADLTVHGGVDKAVYAYPSEHYPFWQAELERDDLGWGMFGENLTTEGLLERDTRIGDVIRAGTAVLRVTKPRFPCYKLGVKFAREDILDLFLLSRRSGFYTAVLQEGDVAAGDPVERVSGEMDRPTVAEAVDARIREQDEEE